MTGQRLTLALVMVVVSATAFARQSPPAAAAKAKGNDQETTARLKNLPPAVRATVEAETKSATIKGISKEKEKGQTVYELETMIGGRTRDLMIDSAGKVYEVEEQIDADQAPAPVRSALEAQGAIVKLESVMVNGTTTYEGQVKTKAGKKVTMALGADGHATKK